MTTSILNRLAPTQVELEIPITPEELNAAEERAFRKLAKNVKIPGFRPGKIPRRVFEQNYGAQTIASQAMEDVIPEVYAKAIREHDLAPVERPQMELLPDEPGKPKRIKCTVEVRPEIDLGPYKGLEIDRPKADVSDEEVDRSLQTLARDRATLVPAEREARLGDVVTIDYEGKIDGVAFEGGTAKGQQTELQEDRFIPGFASGIAGMKVGETKDVEAIFPEQYQEPKYAGKTAVFTIVMHEVKELELPTIDDEFAKAVSQNETLDALRADIRRRLEAHAQTRARRDLGNAVVEKLIDAHEVALPEVMVEREVENMVKEAESLAARMGMSVDDYLKAVDKTEEQLRAEYRPTAERRVKGELLIEAVAKAEHIHATPSDIQDELERLGQQYGQPVERVRQALGNNVVGLMSGIIRTKTLDFLIDHADIKSN